METIDVKLKANAAEAIEKLTKHTGRNRNQVIADAINIYAWIVAKQLEGYKVVAYKGEWLRPESGKIIPDFVKKEAA